MYEKVVSIGAHAAIVAVALWATAAHPAPPIRPPLVIHLPVPGPAGPSRAPFGGPVVEIPTIPPISVTQGALPIPSLPGTSIATPGPGGPIGLPATGGDTVAVDVSVVDEAPELLSAPPPVYPSLLRLAGISGKVLVEAVVDTAGRVEPNSARVVDATDPAFGASALASMRRALFRPARMYGKPVRVLVRLPVMFALRL
jgi:protein TonB